MVLLYVVMDRGVAMETAKESEINIVVMPHIIVVMMSVMIAKIVQLIPPVLVELVPPVTIVPLISVVTAEVGTTNVVKDAMVLITATIGMILLV